ncbi:MAG: 4Fe-4S dicluster domain-containing protein [Spirochaetes bacterium]|nr:4Fe-4S dicluster domain-containing protein [Spirochaetota bacterium]
MADKAFLVDTTKCIGCKACQVACKQWNNLPEEKSDSFFEKEYTYPDRLSHITYNHIVFSDIQKDSENKTFWQMMHKKCNHCEIPNCMAVCPADAVYKEDCWVLINESKCIGCGECEKACIYNVPQVSDRDYYKPGSDQFISRGKAYKCHACMLNKRDIPACADVCPTGALTYDHRITIIEKAKKRIKAVSVEFPEANIYGTDQFGGLHVITILKDKPYKFGLERRPKPVKSGLNNKTKALYGILAMFTPGIPFIRKFVYKFSKTISKNA